MQTAAWNGRRWALIVGVTVGFCAAVMASPLAGATGPHAASASEGPRAALDRGQVKAVIQSARKRWARCYREARARTPGIAGKVKVAFTIQANGSVANARVEASAFDDKRFHTCLTTTVENLRFPSNDGDTEITYPLVFEPD